MSSTRPPASVIAAGIVAIIGSCLAILGCAFVLLGLSLIGTEAEAPQLAASVKSMTTGAVFIFMAFAVVGIFTGIGLLRLKKWARISAMIWAGITACFGSIALLITLVMPFPVPTGQPQLPFVAAKVLLFVSYGVPVGIAVWWLILLNRPAIRAHFFGAAVVTAPELPKKARCPLPVTVIAAFLAFSFLCVFMMALFGFPFPVILFGRVVRGELGSGIFALTSILTFACALGLLTLKRWSYPVIIGLQAFWLASATITFLSPSYEKNVQYVLEEMQVRIPQMSAGLASDAYLHNRSWTLIGLLPSVVILVILLYYRGAFLKAAEEAGKDGPTATGAL